ncbi:hypothetical protein NT6N_31240 [Oceaniferula spumae]|uniref:Uncharacterized protein n=1 Tax=Oceaniferula spumae TaxID=2979115 RepID=A0AAT9FQ94_9BACT
MFSKPVLVVMACGLCLVTGWLIGRSFPAAQESVDASDETSSQARKTNRRASPASQDSSRSARRSARVDGTKQESLAAQSGLSNPDATARLVVVPLGLLDSMSETAGFRSGDADIFDKDGRIEAILEISEQDKTVIQTSWKQALEKIRKLETNSAKTEDLQDGSVKITVKPAVDALAVIGQEFQSVVSGRLGENRADALLSIKQVGRMFTPKAEDRVYTIKTESIGNGQWRYSIRYSTGDEAKQWIGTSVPPSLRHITDAAKINPTMSVPLAEDPEE